MARFAILPGSRSTIGILQDAHRAGGQISDSDVQALISQVTPGPSPIGLLHDARAGAQIDSYALTPTGYSGPRYLDPSNPYPPSPRDELVPFHPPGQPALPPP